MQHVGAVSLRRPPAAAEDLNVTGIIGILSSVVALMGQISTVFGVSLDLGKKTGSQT